ncbi:MAG: hypothetical protein AB1646_20685 [Thermodesulfobacteriota bacterium]
MPVIKRQYRAIVSSDWSECLSPNGPFDPISFNYPDLTDDLSQIFRQYTGNVMSLTEACSRIGRMLPESFTVEQMDAYLAAGFRAYTNVPALMRWCADRDVLFMLNTTGFHGYFQRAIAAGLLPEVPVVSANPMIRYTDKDDSGRYELNVREINDKAANTATVLRETGLSPNRLVIMGDSGGDGPHFRWGAEVGAFLVGNMTKASLHQFCGDAGISIHKLFGASYRPGETRDLERELQTDFLELTEVIDGVLRA